ncbi:MAG: tRNA threonylcarbamoyladenosine dehydratase [Eggerthellales bacterium]|nr:tRNA threonylcarbamoyladenosine dehydratase [Eggerthellales bacterium]
MEMSRPTEPADRQPVEPAAQQPAEPTAQQLVEPTAQQPAETNQFARTELLLGADAVARLKNARVAVFGVGGVGGYVVEALARTGVGALDVIDNDTVSLTNLNRQIIATYETLGKSKVQVAAERIASINPACKVTAHECFYLPETRERFVFSDYDYVVDAVDTVAAKLSLVEACRDAGVPCISSMGAGNKLDPTAFQVADIYETSVCPLAKVMRRECKKRGIDHLKVVYSQEPPLKPAHVEGGEVKATGRGVPGSVAFVPSVVGLIIASEVVKDLIK